MRIFLFSLQVNNEKIYLVGWHLCGPSLGPRGPPFDHRNGIVCEKKQIFFNQQNISLLKTDRAPHAVPAWQGQAQARCNPGISPKGSQAARRRV